MDGARTRQQHAAAAGRDARIVRRWPAGGYCVRVTTSHVRASVMRSRGRGPGVTMALWYVFADNANHTRRGCTQLLLPRNCPLSPRTKNLATYGLRVLPLLLGGVELVEHGDVGEAAKGFVLRREEPRPAALDDLLADRKDARLDHFGVGLDEVPRPFAVVGGVLGRGGWLRTRSGSGVEWCVYGLSVFFV